MRGYTIAYDGASDRFSVSSRYSWIGVVTWPNVVCDTNGWYFEECDCWELSCWLDFISCSLHFNKSYSFCSVLEEVANPVVYFVVISLGSIQGLVFQVQGMSC